MNKFVLLSCCLLAFPAMAEKTCVGGKLITANKYGSVDGVNQDKGGYCKSDGSDCNGKTFCISDGGMNWWSTQLWCESNGRRMATWEEMCPGIPTAIDEHKGACPNLTNLERGDLYTPLKNGDCAFAVYSNGRINCIYSLNTWRAVCE